MLTTYGLLLMSTPSDHYFGSYGFLDKREKRKKNFKKIRPRKYVIRW